MASGRIYIYLLLSLAFTGLCFGYPKLKGKRHYTVTWNDDDGYLFSSEDDDYATTTTSTARPFLGRKPCTQGPAYWCHNISRASECNALQHCITKVWEKPIVSQPKLSSEEDHDACDECVAQMEPKRLNFLSNKTALDEAREKLDKVCGLLDSQMGNKECSQTTEAFFKILLSQMDSKMICHVSGVCHSDRITTMLANFHEKNGKRMCSKCEYYVGEVGASLKLLTKSELRFKLLEFCGEAASYTEACRQAVIHEMDAIYDFVQNRMEPSKLCGEIGLCSKKEFLSTPTMMLMQAPQKPKESRCDFCKDFVKTIHDWALDGKLEDFQQVLHKLCNQMGKYGKECVLLVDQYGKQLQDALAKDLDPETACETIKICPSSKGLQEEDHSSIWTIIAAATPEEYEDESNENEIFNDDTENDDDGSIVLMKGVRLPGERLTGDDERNAINNQLIDGNDVDMKIEDNKRCIMCEFIITKLDQRLKDNVTEEKVKEEVEQICTRLPRTVGGRCQNFVELYGDELIKYFSQEVDPAEICKLLKQCQPQDQKQNDEYDDDYINFI